jgi:hypothetical protein
MAPRGDVRSGSYPQIFTIRIEHFRGSDVSFRRVCGGGLRHLVLAIFPSFTFTTEHEMTGRSPSQSAEYYFKRAYDTAIAATNHTKNVQDETGIAVYDIAASMAAISKGLGDMAIGLRATYMLIERVEQKLDRQRTSSR